VKKHPRFNNIDCLELVIVEVLLVDEVLCLVPIVASADADV
jgi:hypothetical protein